MKKHIIALLIIICACYILLFASHIKLEHKIWSLPLKLIISSAIPIILAATFSYYLRSIKFKYLLAKTGEKISITNSILYYISGFSMTLTPARSGEAVRTWLMKRNLNIPYSKGVFACISDRIFDVISLLAIVTLLPAFTSNISTNNTFNTLIALTALSALSCFLLFYFFEYRKIRYFFYYIISITGIKNKALKKKYFRSILLSISQIIKEFKKIHLKDIFYFSMLSVIIWTIEAVSIYYVANSFGSQIELTHAIILMALAHLIGGLSPLPGGMISTEIIMIMGLTSTQLSHNEAVIITSLFRMCTLIYGICLGIISFLWLQSKPVEQLKYYIYKTNP